MVQQGEKIPAGKFTYVPIADAGDDPTVCVRPSPITSDKLFDGRRVVLVGIPGAFTPTCSENHLPGFLKNLDQIKSKGIEQVYCLAVNDAFVMSAFGRLYGLNKAGVQTLSDANVEWLMAADLVFDGTAHGLGLRAKRFAAIIEKDGTVSYIGVESPGEVKASSAEAVLAHL